MIRKLLGSLLMVGVVGAAASTASDASAGQQSTLARLVKQSDGSGTMFGSFASFRNNADPKAYVDFSNFGGSNIVLGSLNNVNMMCTVPASLTAAFNLALLSRDYFSVDWNAAGQCTSIYVSNASEYGNY
jgi:hypothetical protein